MSTLYTLLTAPLPGVTTQLLVTSDFRQVINYAGNWALSNFLPITTTAKRHYLNPEQPPETRPEGYSLTGRRDGLILHAYGLPQGTINIVNQVDPSAIVDMASKCSVADIVKVISNQPGELPCQK